MTKEEYIQILEAVIQEDRQNIPSNWVCNDVLDILEAYVDFLRICSEPLEKIIKVTDGLIALLKLRLRYCQEDLTTIENNMYAVIDDWDVAADIVEEVAIFHVHVMYIETLLSHLHQRQEFQEQKLINSVRNVSRKKSLNNENVAERIDWIEEQLILVGFTHFYLRDIIALQEVLGIPSALGELTCTELVSQRWRLDDIYNHIKAAISSEIEKLKAHAKSIYKENEKESPLPEDDWYAMYKKYVE